MDYLIKHFGDFEKSEKDYLINHFFEGAKRPKNYVINHFSRREAPKKWFLEGIFAINYYFEEFPKKTT